MQNMPCKIVILFWGKQRVVWLVRVVLLFMPFVHQLSSFWVELNLNY